MAPEWINIRALTWIAIRALLTQPDDATGSWPTEREAGALRLLRGDSITVGSEPSYCRGRRWYQLGMGQRRCAERDRSPLRGRASRRAPTPAATTTPAATPTSTATPTPTATPMPTATPLPTATPMPSSGLPCADCEASTAELWIADTQGDGVASRDDCLDAARTGRRGLPEGARGPPRHRNRPLQRLVVRNHGTVVWLGARPLPR